jgi:hypothetical protein
MMISFSRALSERKKKLFYDACDDEKSLKAERDTHSAIATTKTSVGRRATVRRIFLSKQEAAPTCINEEPSGRETPTQTAHNFGSPKRFFTVATLRFISFVRLRTLFGSFGKRKFFCFYFSSAVSRFVVFFSSPFRQCVSQFNL